MPIRTFTVPEQLADEDERQAALDACGIGEAPDPDFNALVDEAAKTFAVPIALVSIIDGSRQWFKARTGLETASTPRSISFCGHTINSDGVFAVPDALADERFAGNPLVIAGPRIRFYAGAPLVTASGHKLGSFCLIGTKPRPPLSGDEEERLTRFAARAVELIEAKQPRD